MSRSVGHACAAMLLAAFAMAACWSFSQEAPPTKETAKAACAKKPSAKAVEPSAEEALLKKLQEPTEFSFEAAPLKDALAALAKKHAVPIVIHRKQVMDSGGAEDMPVTRTVKGVSLETGLNRLLGEHRLAWVLRHEVIDVTSREDADTFLVTRVYAVSDLVLPALDYDSLIELITNTISPDSWPETGGPGTIQPGRLTLTIRHSQAAHRKIAALLAALRRADKVPADGTPPETAIPCYGARAERRILDALRQKVAVSFKDASLADVAKTFAKEYGLPLEFDRRELSDSGIDPTKVQVGLTASGITLRSALDLLLREPELSWIVEDDELRITSRDAVQSSLKTRVYPVPDLHHMAEVSGDELIDLVTNTILPDQWSDAGGPGNLEYDARSRSLVCWQHREAHEALEDLLTDLRRTEPKVSAEGASLGDDEVTVCQYVIDREGAPRAKIIEAAATLVRELIAADSWRAKDTPFYLRTSADGFAVRHTGKVQREIQQLLVNLDVAAPRQANPAAPPPD